MPPTFFQTNGHVLICQDASCQSRSSTLLYKALWKYLEANSLAYYKKGGTVRLSSSGCLGACSYGPTLCVYRKYNSHIEEAWYAAVDFELAKEIVQAVHEQAPLPTRGKYS